MDARGLQRKGLPEALAWAQDQFHDCLLNAREASGPRAYLAERGYSTQTIADFRLGFHPDSSTWLIDRARGRFTGRELLHARLIGEVPDKKGYYDHFVNRIVFPIHDDGGRPVAFGGRVLPGDERLRFPKYWRSPSSEFFCKESVLYGFHAARDSIRQSRTAVVVEGYTDCLTCHQHGVKNAVATFAGELTQQHLSQIGGLASRVVLAYDGDARGWDTAKRVASSLAPDRIDLRIVVLPEGADPDGLISGSGVEEFRRIVEAARSL